MVEIITHYVEELNLKQSLVYVNRVDTAKLLAGLLCGKGIPSTHVSGDTKDIVQDSIQQDLEDGNIRLVTNAKLWVEGKDIPSIDSVFVLRNTDPASKNSIQMIGRAQRGPASEDGTDKAHIIWGY
jgi:superfamily II DNA or RNA helicase